MTDEPNYNARLREIMDAHGLTSPATAALIWVSPHTVASWVEKRPEWKAYRRAPRWAVELLTRRIAEVTA